ncbi:MAG: FAD-dependent oxidoreductase [Deltaproteobacteria bacterium]|nr:FAD-dependent oxidoreductase [Deltaproteobacteria bacterium]
MAEGIFKYIIAGGGLTGASAIKGIRSVDKEGSILLVGKESHLPYDRPPLTKKLWFGKKKLEEIFLEGRDFYEKNNVSLRLGFGAVSLRAGEKRLIDGGGKSYRYEKLLLATGGFPNRLPIPGGDAEGICYYRYFDDYVRLRAEAEEGRSAVVIGGGFIGSEIAAALCINKVKVTMVFPSGYIAERVFPESLGLHLQNHFTERGVRIISGTRPLSIKKKGNRFITVTDRGEFESDILIAGIGITPATSLAEGAGLRTGNGIIVDDFLRTSHPDIYAAGDNALFHYQALDKMARVEHWENALKGGAQAGRNMAGANEPYKHMPYFFSDLFEFGYEAVGEVSSGLKTFADWQKENDTGVIYYLKDSKVRGVMLCNVWEKVDEAREIIRSQAAFTPQKLNGTIR